MKHLYLLLTLLCVTSLAGTLKAAAPHRCIERPPRNATEEYWAREVDCLARGYYVRSVRQDPQGKAVNSCPLIPTTTEEWEQLKHLVNARVPLNIVAIEEHNNFELAKNVYKNAPYYLAKQAAQCYAKGALGGLLAYSGIRLIAAAGRVNGFDLRAINLGAFIGMIGGVVIWPPAGVYFLYNESTDFRNRTFHTKQRYQTALQALPVSTPWDQLLGDADLLTKVTETIAMEQLLEHLGQHATHAPTDERARDRTFTLFKLYQLFTYRYPELPRFTTSGAAPLDPLLTPQEQEVRTATRARQRAERARREQERRAAQFIAAA